ncbi:hypothetical protein GQL56_17935 [Pseudomonas putida]|nr:hypothetical protein [Pseudomonas putida]
MHSMSITKTFYQARRVTTVITERQCRSILRSFDAPLAETKTEVEASCNLLATDDKGSVFTVTGVSTDEVHTYSAYGNTPNMPSPESLLGFNGERPEQLGMYILGDGYRPYSPLLMRFLAADSLSPFGKGGINAYAYCAGDPTNYIDPTGHIKIFRTPSQKLEHYGTKIDNTFENIKQKQNHLVSLEKLYKKAPAHLHNRNDAYRKTGKNAFRSVLNDIEEDAKRTKSAIKKLTEKADRQLNKYEAAKLLASAEKATMAASAPRASIVSNYGPSAPRGSIVSNYDPSAPRGSIIPNNYEPIAPQLSLIMEDVRERQNASQNS